MRQMLVFRATFFGSSKSEVPSQAGKQIQDGRSFVEVLQSNFGATAKVGWLKLLSSQILDLFPGSIHFEKGIDGVEQRLVVDCYEMESSTPSFQHCLQNPLVAAGAKLGRKKRKGISGNRWVKKHLGFIRYELDWILGGLALKPKGKHIRVGLFCPAHPVPTVDFWLGSGLDTGSGFGLIPVLDTGFCSVYWFRCGFGTRISFGHNSHLRTSFGLRPVSCIWSLRILIRFLPSSFVLVLPSSTPYLGLAFDGIDGRLWSPMPK